MIFKVYRPSFRTNIFNLKISLKAFYIAHLKAAAMLIFEKQAVKNFFFPL